MLKTTKPPRSQKGMRRLLKWYEKKGRPITRTVILYRSEPLARNSIRTQHQALTLGTKRASALGAATLERETRNAEKEQHYQHLPLLAAIHNLISTAVSDTNAAQPITHRICRCHALVVIRLPSVPLRQKLLAVALCALRAPQSANEPPSPLLGVAGLALKRKCS